MNRTSAKNKIILVVIGWLILSLLMFFYFFKILDNSNQSTLNAMAQDQKDLVFLRSQSQSYKQAEADLQKLRAEPIQPEDFFSKDVTLVKEIVVLENLGVKYNIQMQLSGVSGTVTNLPKAKTATSLVMIPYSISLSGDFQRTLGFIENLENLSFVTNLTGLSLSSAGGTLVNTTLGANFYLRQ